MTTDSTCRRLMAGTVLLVLAACAPGTGGDASTLSRTDSAGVEIVTTGWSAEGPVWRRIAPSPRVILGDREDDARSVLAGVQGAVLLGDGRIVIANGQSSTLLIHDSTGALVRVVGRAGSGPGEFRRIAALWRLEGDTIAVWDAGTRRIALFDPTGDPARTIPLAAAPGGDGAPVHAVTGIFGDGSLLAHYSRPPQPAGPGPLRPDEMLYRYTPSGDRARALSVHRGQELHLARSERGGYGVTVAVFGRSTTTLARGGHYYVADDDAAEIRVVDTTATLRRVVRWQPGDRALSTLDIDSAVARAVAGYPPERRDAQARTKRTQITHTLRPAFSSVVLDAEGRIWVRRWDAGGETDSWWDVFGPDGSRLGVVPMERGASLLFAAREHVLLLRRDSLDRELVELWALIGP